MKRESSEGYISDKSSSNEAVDQVSSVANERAGRLQRVESRKAHWFRGQMVLWMWTLFSLSCVFTVSHKVSFI